MSVTVATLGSIFALADAAAPLHTRAGYLGSVFVLSGLRTPADGCLRVHAPPPAPGAAARATWRIHVEHVEAAKLAALAQVQPPPSCSAWQERSSVLTVTDWGRRVRVHLVAAPLSPWTLAQDVYCGIRRLALIERRPCVLLHAAAVELDGRCVLLCGPKGAGKSHACLTALLESGARYVAGDKLCVWLDDAGELACGGLLAAVRVNLDDQPPCPRDPRIRSLLELAHLRAHEPGRVVHGKVGLTALEFCEALAVAWRAQARPMHVVHLDRPASSVGLAPLASERLHSVLTAALLDEQADVDAARIESDSVAAALDPAQARPILAALARRCIGHQLTGRPDAATLASLLGALTR